MGREERKKVVVVGGGIGGISVAKGLGKSADVTVIERRTAYQYQPPALRATVDENYAWQQFIPYPSNPSYKLVHATATSIECGAVVLDNGCQLKYDILVIATGSSVSFLAGEPVEDLQAQVRVFEQVHHAIQTSQKILIAGGGPVGVELAGEILTAFPNKQVTLVDSSNALLSRAEPPLLPEMQRAIQTKLEAKGAKVILGARAEMNLPRHGFQTGPATVALSNGLSVECDLRFVCIGGGLNNSAFSKTFGGAMTKQGKLRVNSCLQVEGETNVFALGDIAAAGETGLAYIAGSVHAPIVIQNIKRILGGKQPNSHHKPWTVSSMFVPLGPDTGVAQVGFLPFGNGVHTWGLFANLKNSQRLFVDKTWETIYGRGPPKRKEDSPAFWKEGQVAASGHREDLSSRTNMVVFGLVVAVVAGVAIRLLRSEKR